MRGALQTRGTVQENVVAESHVKPECSVDLVECTWIKSYVIVPDVLDEMMLHSLVRKLLWRGTPHVVALGICSNVYHSTQPKGAGEGNESPLITQLSRDDYWVSWHNTDTPDHRIGNGRSEDGTVLNVAGRATS